MLCYESKMGQGLRRDWRSLKGEPNRGGRLARRAGSTIIDVERDVVAPGMVVTGVCQRDDNGGWAGKEQD